MKKLIAILLALVCVFALCACGSSSTPAASEPAKEVLVMGTSADYAPFEFMYPNDKGELVYGGIDVLVGQYIADYTGKELKIENMGFDYLLVSLAKGDPKNLLPGINEAIADMMNNKKVEEFTEAANALEDVWQEVSAD